MKEFTHQFFNQEVRGRISEDSNDTAHVSIIDVETGNAWARVFSYEKSVEILEADEKKLIDLSSYYQAKAFKGSSLILVLSRWSVSFVRFVERSLKSILGSFAGFGLLGLFLVITAALVGIIVSAHALLITAPFIIVSLITRWRVNSKADKEIVKLRQAVINHLSE